MAMDSYDGGPGSGPQPGGAGEPDFSELTEAERRWKGAEFNYAKNPMHTTRIRVEKARAEYAKAKAKAEKKKLGDEYRDEDFEDTELVRGKQEDRDAANISQHGRWGSRASDKAGARDGFATDPPVSEAQRKAMFAAKAGNSTLGIPQSVGKEFANADPGGKLPEHK
jgi:hypothetical protein